MKSRMPWLLLSVVVGWGFLYWGLTSDPDLHPTNLYGPHELYEAMMPFALIAFGVLCILSGVRQSLLGIGILPAKMTFTHTIWWGGVCATSAFIFMTFYGYGSSEPAPANDFEYWHSSGTLEYVFLLGMTALTAAFASYIVMAVTWVRCKIKTRPEGQPWLTYEIAAWFFTLAGLGLVFWGVISRLIHDYGPGARSLFFGQLPLAMACIGGAIFGLGVRIGLSAETPGDKKIGYGWAPWGLGISFALAVVGMAINGCAHTYWADISPVEARSTSQILTRLSYISLALTLGTSVAHLIVAMFKGFRGANHHTTQPSS